MGRRVSQLAAGVDLELELVEGRLVGSIGRDRFALVPTGSDEFRISGADSQSFRFARGARGDRRAEHRVEGSTRRQVFTAVEDIPSLYELADEVAGRYSCDDLGVAYDNFRRRRPRRSSGGAPVSQEERGTAAPGRDG